MSSQSEQLDSRLYLGAQMRKVHMLWRNAINDAVHELNLTEARWLVMVNLQQIGEGSTQQMLANELGIEMPSLTRTLKQLEAQKLIARHTHEQDGRAQCLSFTPSGHQCLGKLRPIIEEVRSSLFSDIDQTMIDVTAQVMLKMEQNAKQLLQQNRQIQETQ